MSVTTDTVSISVEQQCDQLMAAAGLRPRWEPPEDLPQQLIDSAAILRTIADTDRITSAHYETMRVFGNRVINYARSWLDIDYEEPLTSFRAATAIERGNGNCIAKHELITGILTKAGVAQYALGSWSGAHASTSFLIGEMRIGVDGGMQKADLLRGDSTPAQQPLVAAYRQALEQNKVVVCERTSFGIVLPEEISILNLKGINEKPVRAGSHRTLTMPASMAILMYSAIAVEGTKDPKYDPAKEVLAPYVPKH